MFAALHKCALWRMTWLPSGLVRPLAAVERYPYQEVLRDWTPSTAAPKHSFTVDPETFYQLFPFHILMDRECRVAQRGAALARLFPGLQPGTLLSEHFHLRHPYIKISYDTICDELNSAFLLKAVSSGLELKGQMVPVRLPATPPLHQPGGCVGGDSGADAADSTATPGGSVSRCPMAAAAADSTATPGGSVSRCPMAAAAAASRCPVAAAGASGAEGLVFMGSARVGSLDDLQGQGLFLSDIPLHDLNRDFVLLAEQRQAEAQLKERFEALSLDLQKANLRLSEATKWLEEERRRSDSLLYQMLPPQVAVSLKHGQRTPASEHEEVTILFSDIVGFTEISSRCSPMEVCSLLDELYHQFDAVIEEYPELYKVETIGDAYMVVSNVTIPCHNHADLLLEFAVRMHEVSRGVRSSLGEHVVIRVGLHTGPVVAGVVGKKMPRFCLFGDTVNTASRMESHGIPGHIHISDACYQCIRAKGNFVIRERGSINVKGKGAMRTYLIVPAEQSAILPAVTSRRVSARTLSISPCNAEDLSLAFASLPPPSGYSRCSELAARSPSFSSVAGVGSDPGCPPWELAGPGKNRPSDSGGGAGAGVGTGTASGFWTSTEGERSSAGGRLRRAVPRNSSRLAQRSVDAGPSLAPALGSGDVGLLLPASVLSRAGSSSGGGGMAFAQGVDLPSPSSYASLYSYAQFSTGRCSATGTERLSPGDCRPSSGGPGWVGGYGGGGLERSASGAPSGGLDDGSGGPGVV